MNGMRFARRGRRREGRDTLSGQRVDTETACSRGEGRGENRLEESRIIKWCEDVHTVLQPDQRHDSGPIVQVCLSYTCPSCPLDLMGNHLRRQYNGRCVIDDQSHRLIRWIAGWSCYLCARDTREKERGRGRERLMVWFKRRKRVNSLASQCKTWHRVDEKPLKGNDGWNSINCVKNTQAFECNSQFISPKHTSEGCVKCVQWLMTPVASIAYEK